ncbi:cation transporter [Caenimonas sedimenti]|uniref:Cation transporter n=1 Tax=Caenimonas sedimenti TaxID=2596921 RepID=A0A562ZHL2_9BURK|nr:cation diffusion facilitator family transporter [Caenimonas sedimenti]TWO68003.1 cation transporter [Caenimonas sedimenti]
MSGSHNHALPSTGNERSLWIALALTTAFMITEVVAGVITNSLALISDAAHMLTDSAALAIALAAVRVAKRPADAARTYGYHRFEILAAAFNALMLFGVAIYILVEAYGRFKTPSDVQTGTMMVVAIAGLIVNLISMKLLRAGKDSSLNVKGAYLEVWSDMLGSLGVIGGAVLMRFTGWTWVDPLIAVAIALWVLPRTWILLKESLNILLEGVPSGIEVAKVTQALQRVPGVTGIHDLHIWALTSGKVSLTAHVVHDPVLAHDALLEPLKAVLAKEFSIFHTTLQLEIEACRHTIDGDNYVGPVSPPEQHAH